MKCRPLPTGSRLSCIDTKLQDYPGSVLPPWFQLSSAVIEQHEDVVAEMACPAEVMQHHHHCFTSYCQLPEQRHCAHLMAQIEIAEVRRAADIVATGKQQCNPRALTLASGKCNERPLGQARQFHALNCLHCHFVVQGSKAKQAARMRMPPEQHVFIHIAPEISRLFLQQNPQIARQVAPCPGSGCFSRYRDGGSRRSAAPIQAG